MATLNQLSNKEKAQLHKAAHTARFFKNEVDKKIEKGLPLTQGDKTYKTRYENQLKKLADKLSLEFNDGVINYTWSNEN